MANPTLGVAVAELGFDDLHKYLPMASTAQTYYVGEMIGRNSSGYGTKFDDAAALKFEGVMTELQRLVVPSGGSDGDYKLPISRPRHILMTIASAAITDVGKPVFAAYSNEVQFHPGTYHNLVGTMVGYVNSTTIWVEPFYQKAPPLVVVSMPYDANIVDRSFFVADRPYLVVDIRGRVEVLGTGGACTAAIKKVASGTNIASGTALTTASYDLVGTDETNQVLTLSATLATINIAAGTAIGLDITGTATNAVGVVQVTLMPVG